MARFIELTKVKVAPDRQRRERSQEDHQNLLISISEGEAGLLHAPILWKDGEDYWLVVGEGRFNVVSEMYDLGMQLRYEGEEVPFGLIPFTLIGETTLLGRFEAEYDENTKRTALTVAETARATAQLFELKKMRAKSKGEAAPTVAELSVDLRGSSLGGYQEQTRKELIVARHLDDKDVRDAPTIQAAFNVVKKKEMQRKHTALAGETGPRVDARKVELVQADCRDWFKTQPDGMFDLVISDPPYGMGADTFGHYSESTDHRYDDSHESWQNLMGEIMPQLARVCKPDAHAYLFCDFDRFHELRYYMDEHGWTVHRTPLIWHNPTGFRTPWPDSGPQRKYECILYAKRGEKKTLKVMSDVIECVRDKESVHQAQKPVALLRNLLDRSALPTDRVLDFCAGSCSTGIACHEVKLSCICVEREAEAYGAGVKRLQALKD